MCTSNAYEQLWGRLINRFINVIQRQLQLLAIHRPAPGMCCVQFAEPYAFQHGGTEVIGEDQRAIGTPFVG